MKKVLRIVLRRLYIFSLFYDYKLTAKDIDLSNNFAKKLRAFWAFINRD
jgi:hypothetical protein